MTTRCKSSTVAKTIRGKLMLKNFQRLIGKNLKRIIKCKASELLSSIGLKAPLSNIPVLGDILF